MSIRVCFFASLRERMRRAEETLPASAAGTVGSVWSSVAGEMPMPANTLMAVNREYVDAGYGVHDGDEVAFFPPVTGG